MGFRWDSYGGRRGYFVVGQDVWGGRRRRGRASVGNVVVILALLDNITLFLCKVSLVKSKLGHITKGRLRLMLCGLAGAPVGNMLLKAVIATVVRSSSTAAIVIIKFMGSKVVGITRTVKVVVKTGVNADIAK